ncbi:MAG: chlorophyll synthase ChlG [Chloroflexaceae bacterium]|nr:chlorophyll synthase ChlG [Chloroflexaceae bacterium]
MKEKAGISAVIDHSLALMNPVTWLAPAWAFFCGAVASGAWGWSLESLGRVALGMMMAGPILCGLSQVINNYCDREVDAINEPHRPVPSGLVSLRHVQVMSLLLTVAGSSIALLLGREVALFVGIGLIFAISYSLKPFRAKRNGWVGNALVAFSYEGLAWLAGHAAMAAPLFWDSPNLWKSATLAFLYSVSAHGIMTVNDFKSIVGDTQMGIKSIPVMYGEKVAAWLVVLKMSLAQALVVVLLFWWGNPVAAVVVLLLLLAQIVPFRRFLRHPSPNAVFFNLTAIQLSIWGMLVSALGLAL